MSTLYIGPYRQTDIDGQISRYFLTSLIQNGGAVVSMPVYVANPSKGVISKKIVFDTEKIIEKPEKYDTIVQHMDILDMQYMPDVATTHIAFPILDNIANLGLTKFQYDILNYFDKIIVQSEKEKTMLVENCGFAKNKISMFIPDINKKQYLEISKKQKYEFKNYCTNKKLYFIGNVNEDINIIKKIVFSLYHVFTKMSDPPICIFFLDFDNNPDINQLDSDIKQMRANFGMPIDYGREIFIFKHFSEEDLAIGHGSCDIYLSLNEKRTNYLYEHYARLSGNKVISMDDVTDCFSPYYTSNYNYSYGMYKRYISMDRLISTFKELL